MPRSMKKMMMMQMTNLSSQSNATLKGKCFARPASYSRSQSLFGGATIQARCSPAPPSPLRSRGSLSRSTRGGRAEESGVTLMPNNRDLPLSIISPSLAPESMFCLFLVPINSSDYSSVSYRSMLQRLLFECWKTP